jgi:opacity protein-like surface antigen
VASVFFGSGFDLGGNNFIDNGDNVHGSFTWGGQIAYAWKGWLGGEFLTDFAPSEHVGQSILLAEHPNVNSYMGNAYISLPFGSGESFHPFLSTGIGGITMHTKFFTLAPDIPIVGLPIDSSNVSTVSTDETRFGWDIGGGFMAFVSHWGVRADVRYFKATDNNNSLNLDNTLAQGATQQLLNGFQFWRGTLGVSARW